MKNLLLSSEEICRICPAYVTVIIISMIAFSFYDSFPWEMSFYLCRLCVHVY